MRLTIMYRHPQRPDEAGMVIVPDKAKAAEVKDRLENRGFLIIETATTPFAKANYRSDRTTGDSAEVGAGSSGRGCRP
jgi:hypothetical protein